MTKPKPICTDHPIVQTQLGKIQGAREDGINVFRGVRYAEPPVGPLRFLPPMPIQPWRGVQDASAFGPAALQPFDISVGLHADQMSEDCLTLNIWTPCAPGPHPVIVWIHGGGQTIGSTRRPEYDGTGFARQGIACVSVGYRLGVLGFLELGELLGGAYRGSGNNALKDIQLALAWVQSHIACFNGDPSRITLGGESAGAKNVAALLSTDSSRQLFQRVVVLSGGAHTTHSVDAAEAVARRAMAEVGCSDARQLLTSSAAQLLEVQDAAIQTHSAKFAFRPVVDGSFLGTPLNTRIQNAERTPLPALISTCRDEYAAFVDLEAPLPPLGKADISHMDATQMVEMQGLYAEAFPGISALELRVRMLTAEEYWIPSLRVAESFAEKGDDVWLCRFDHSGSNGQRPMHVADLPYWWNNLPTNDTPHSEADISLARLMQASLAGFVRGEPFDRMPAGMQWPPYEGRHRQTLCWSTSPRILADPRKKERLLWVQRMPSNANALTQRNALADLNPEVQQHRMGRGAE